MPPPDTDKRQSADQRAELKALADLVNAVPQGASAKRTKRPIDKPAIVILSVISVLLIIGAVLLFQPVHPNAAPILKLNLPAIRINPGASAQNGVGVTTPQAVAAAKAQANGAVSTAMSDAQSESAKSGSDKDEANEAAANKAQSELAKVDKELPESADAQSATQAQSLKVTENKPGTPVHNSTNSPANPLASKQLAQALKAHPGLNSSKLPSLAPSRQMAQSPQGRQPSSPQTPQASPGQISAPPVAQLMPGPNPHGFILLRTPLEQSGWTVLWHDGVGAECWKPGMKHAYLWIHPSASYITLNGRRISVDLPAVERNHQLYGDSKIVAVANRHLR